MARLFQFSVRGLLWAVTFLAVGIAALVNANGLWLGLSWGLALYALAAAILLLTYRREEKRAFWFGFSLFGWLYLLLFLLSMQNWFRLEPLRKSQLLATQLAQLAHENLLPESRRLEHIQVAVPFENSAAGASMSGMPPATGAGRPMMPGSMMGGGMPGMGAGGAAWSSYQSPNPNYVPLETFTHVFHALCLLLIAAVGGKTCQIIYRTRPSTED